MLYSSNSNLHQANENYEYIISYESYKLEQEEYILEIDVCLIFLTPQ